MRLTLALGRANENSPTHRVFAAGQEINTAGPRVNRTRPRLMKMDDPSFPALVRAMPDAIDDAVSSASLSRRNRAAP